MSVIFIPKLSLKKFSLAGFTLIELILTIIVVAIVAIPLSLLLFQHMDGVFQSQDYTMALNLARYEMERVNNMSYASVTVGTFNINNFQGYSYYLTRTVSLIQNTPPESLKQVRVDVRKSASSPILVSLITYLVANVIYGL